MFVGLHTDTNAHIQGCNSVLLFIFYVLLWYGIQSTGILVMRPGQLRLY